MNLAASRINTPVSLISLVAISLIIAMLSALELQRAAGWSAAEVSQNLRLAFAIQSNANDGYTARGHGFSLQLTRGAATLTLPNASGISQLRMSFVDARGDAQLAGADPLAGVAHYYLGNDPQAWRRDIALHERVRYTALYDGIDAVFYGNEQRFEYDFIVAPGANPAQIALRFDGATSIQVDRSGDLLLETASGILRQLRPQLYQMKGQRRVNVDGHYVISTPNEVRFVIGAYDAARTLVIDPVIDYGTFLGGSGGDAATRVAVDASGKMTVVGYTFSADLPATLSHNMPYLGGSDARHAFVSKYRPDGSLIYVAYLGGSADDLATDVAVDGNGNSYVVGETRSTDFPVNKTPAHSGDVDAFLVVLNNDGSQLNFGRFIGGSDYDVGHGVALGPNNLVYIAGETWSGNFPVTAGTAFDIACGSCGGISRNYDGFLAVIDTTSNALPYATYYGGGGNDKLHAVAVNRKTGVAYLAGETNSIDLPMRKAFQGTLAGAFDAMIVAFDPANSGDASLLYASYFGGSDEDSAEHMAMDASGLLYVVGGTQSGNLLVKAPYQTALRGSSDAFIFKVDAAQSGSASLIYSSYFGGTGMDDAAAVTIDADGGAIFVGMTDSNDLPIKSAGQDLIGGKTDAYVAKLHASGSTLSFSSYLGGSDDDAAAGVAADAAGKIYVAGDSNSSLFPVTSSGAQTTKRALADATLVRITPGSSGSTSGSSSGPRGTSAAKSSGGAIDAWLMLLIATLALRRRIMAR